MARKTAIVVFFAACILLASYAEAQSCPSITALIPCRQDINSGSCSSACKNTLLPFATVDNSCICNLTKTAASFGYSKEQVIALLNACNIANGRTFPTC